MSTDVEARMAIRDMIERYSDALNQRDFQLVAGMFTPQGEWRAAAPYNITLIGAQIGESMSAMLKNYEFLFQMTHSIVIESYTGDSACARTAIREVGQAKDGATGLDTFGIYEDDLVYTGQGWRFARRHFTPVFISTAPLPGYMVKPS